MKKLLLFFIPFLCCLDSFTQEHQDSNYVEVPMQYFDMQRTGFIPESLARYPEGIEGIKKFLAIHVRYPASAAQRGETGKVILSHSVETDGTVDEITILQSAGKRLDKEAIRLVGEMDPWLPAINGGKPVKVYYKQIINFNAIIGG